MSKKSITTIVVGLIVLVITWLGFNAVFNAIAPSSAAVHSAFAGGSGMSDIIQRSQQAQMIQVLFFVIAALEIVVTGVLAYKWRKPAGA
jgi:hypothetical protein